jgi:hypothetical protein
MADQKKRYGMLISGAVHARPHTATRSLALLEHFNWELFDHTAYSPDLASSDCLKNCLGSQRCDNNDGRCQNMAELTTGKVFSHRRTKTYFPIREMPQFRRRLC